MDPAPVHQALLADYERFLGLERGRSPHTRRAYLTDLRDLLAFAAAREPAVHDVAEIDLALLRSWLAGMSAGGIARSTIARRAASARSFTRWLARTGRARTDAGVRLRSPKAGHPLPGVL
ncbi:MAG: site-specific integrase, partial [Kineosporiaceae bacterium]